MFVVGQWALFTRCGPLLLSTRGGEICSFTQLLRLHPTAEISTSYRGFTQQLRSQPRLPDFAIAYFQIPRGFPAQRFPGPQISNFLDFQVPRSPNSQISRSPDFQTPPPDELSDPNLTPLPMHPGIKCVARSPCCDNSCNILCKGNRGLTTHFCIFLILRTAKKKI